ncbi:hypothetical protein [Glutamicibacter sp.]|uniref:hypothetical protein n=1 Tax=Glutamicibacter sp. TaxID=1931995 RepID=UPI002B45FCBA|nr:hypothetical protein [Glutamicibacter sp.]HJX77583.1 hypothetical protein [Glutamicibacter sp.]
MTSIDAQQTAERWTFTQLKEWSPKWRENLERWLEPNLALVGDAAWGGQMRDMVQLPVQDPLAWANRRIELSGGHWAVAGIRFRGRDVEKPFVDIIQTSLSPDTEGIAALGEVLPYFSEFSPLCLRVALPDPQPWLRSFAQSTTEEFQVTPDLLVVARPVNEMLAQPLAETYNDVSLVPCDPVQAAERVATVYEELTELRPQLNQWATPADAEALKDAAEEGLLFEIQMNGIPAGVLAAEREDAYGFTGFCIQEIALGAAHRGQQVGVAALQRLCRRIPTGTDEVLWGHIHPANVMSLHNAQASGRLVVAAHMWVTPTSYAGMPS